jgi:diguanylate cyclase (GGDEF)-like protein
VSSSVKGLNEAALALSRGDEVVLPSVQMKEADAVGSAILAASYLMADVHHRAYHDSLTGLSNRDLFDELVRFQLASAGRDGSCFALLALDLDNFKQVNDTEGHAAGDALLKIAARRIVDTLRASDVAARIGGDEFAILLARTDLDSAADTARRLVEALGGAYPGVATRISASIGIAIYPTHGTSAAALLERADQALYEAKRLGKNGHAIG